MEPTVDFEEIVEAWILEYDDRLPSNQKDRVRAFIELLGNLEDYGYKKEDITISRRKFIIGKCVNPNHNKNKLRRWISMVVNAFNKAVIIYYGTIKIRKDVVTLEMENKLEALEKRAEECRALKTSADGSEDSESDEDLFDAIQEPIDIENEVREAIKKEDNTFPITEDMLKNMDGPEILWDEDFYKKLEDK